MTSTVGMPTISLTRTMPPSGNATGPNFEPGQETDVFTPADIASWEAGLRERTRFALAVAGAGRGKLTIYAGPDNRGGIPCAVLTGFRSGCHVSRPWTADIQEWISSVLRTAESLTAPPPD
jgi:hypothetical protein